MTQLALFPPPPVPLGIACRHGIDLHWTTDECPQCEADIDAQIAAFQAEVAAGTFDARGYRPSEKRRRAA